MEHLPPLNVVDYLAIVLVLLGAIQGLIRGLSGELARLVSVVAAFFLGIALYRPFGSWLMAHSDYEERIVQAIAFLATIAITIVVMLLIRMGLKHVIKVVINNKKFDRTAGCFAGFMRSLIVMIIIFVVMNIVPNEYFNRIFGEESFIGTGIGYLMPRIRDEISQIEEDKEYGIKLVPLSERRRR